MMSYFRKLNNYRYLSYGLQVSKDINNTEAIYYIDNNYEVIS